ncbi:tRNA 5-methoxyuridine(34)/uridine 5-oxyacetic acid(34) synthase CmoB [Alloalcanivorax xenomutans]|uniref:tRNA 5-methoxyuridine(34)/uridine 5-oxyacetic acid(34) synthase CmoB n=1 Tax=Alloalcanivorax xenomutans TaxID=1094342 RepID=UPI00292E7545|nr:tRNA 5-methoxyuridine(34)/uridine 5-oxyacetic acid(34) synthase CmoB [Alloalcanivorax xenomutans]WOA33156.1 tRNA 5-methoxyuridine(34)/uridine 5-oxyacetic acid(34) synthase CmoB [Alloalcanivorax xenomutans]
METYLTALGAALEQHLGEAAAPMRALSRERLVERPHGDLPRWLSALERLPPGPAPCDFARDTVTIGEPGAAGDTEALHQGLTGLIPWRKGPFCFFGEHIDTEWRSDWKWQRVAPHLSDLRGRRVLDVGCGSGYHGWRMIGAGADWVLGIDPTILFLVQYLAVRRYAPAAPFSFAPLRMEELPAALEAFDTVFSMGVLYHRRSPLDHLLELRDALRPGGELVLETLVVEGDERTVLIPEGRYAAMRNVFFLPSTAQLSTWLRRSGFDQVRCVDECVTTTDEQRATEWMRFQSLPDFLDPDDRSRTREGLPAPRRAVMIARRTP